MAKKGDWVYCHTSLIFCDNTISFTKGEYYEILDVKNNGDVLFIDNQGDEHTMVKLTGIIDVDKVDNNDVSYLSWFSHREEKLKILLDD